jgi:hypothetical protein
MSAYEQVAEEKKKLDDFIKQQYSIIGVREDLSGTWLTLRHPGGEQAVLLLLTADARKYAANVLIRQSRIS